MRFLREEIYLFFSRTDLCLKYRFIIPWDYPYIQMIHKMNLDQFRVHLDFKCHQETSLSLTLSSDIWGCFLVAFDGLNELGTDPSVFCGSSIGIFLLPHMRFFYIRANVCSKSWLFMSLSDYESYFMNHHKLSNKKSEYSIIRAFFQYQFMVSYLLDKRLAIDEKIPDWWLTRVWEPRKKFIICVGG